MRVTTSGGLTYLSVARISFGFQPCCTTFWAVSGRAMVKAPAAPNAARRSAGEKRVMPDSTWGAAWDGLGGSASTYVYGIAAMRVGRCALGDARWALGDGCCAM